jgi:TPR repeat protein
MVKEEGHPNAQVRLGTMYSRGEGVPENAAEAVKWWRKAAHHGNALAQLKLGVVYYKGIGVRKDYVMAYVFTSMAKAQQHQLRADIQVQSQQGISLVLDRLKSKMSKKKILQAQALAFKCYESDYKDCD